MAKYGASAIDEIVVIWLHFVVVFQVGNALSKAHKMGAFLD